MARRHGMSCRDAYHLAAESLDRELTRGERMRLRLHRALCRLCRPLPRQFHQMRDLVRHAEAERADAEEPPPLPPEARERIACGVRRRIESGRDET